jgi:hypothetical protein
VTGRLLRRWTGRGRLCLAVLVYEETRPDRIGLLEKLGLEEIPQRPWRFGVEGPAGREHEPRRAGERVDAGRVPSNNQGAGRAKAQGGSVASGDVKEIADLHFAQEGEMRVAVGGEDRRSRLARVRRASTWPGPKARACPLLP